MPDEHAVDMALRWVRSGEVSGLAIVMYCRLEGASNVEVLCACGMNANKTSIVEGGAPLGKTKRVDSNGASHTRNEIGGAIRLCRPNLMTRPRRYSARTIPICKCPAHG
jgi:hypothetical protein